MLLPNHTQSQSVKAVAGRRLERHCKVPRLEAPRSERPKDMAAMGFLDLEPSMEGCVDVVSSGAEENVSFGPSIGVAPRRDGDRGRQPQARRRLIRHIPWQDDGRGAASYHR